MPEREEADPSTATRQLMERLRDIGNSGYYRQSGGRWKQYRGAIASNH